MLWVFHSIFETWPIFRLNTCDVWSTTLFTEERISQKLIWSSSFSLLERNLGPTEIVVLQLIFSAIIFISMGFMQSISAWKHAIFISLFMRSNNCVAWLFWLIGEIAWRSFFILKKNKYTYQKEIMNKDVIGNTFPVSLVTVRLSVYQLFNKNDMFLNYIEI